jgi:hypothetical protein
MELQDLAAVGEAVGGLAVLVTLIYLAYQFRQTARLERAAGQRELLSQAREWIELTVVHPDLFPVLQRGFHDWESVTPSERERCSGWAWSLLFIAEQAVYMQRDGFIHEVSYQGFLDAALAVVATPGGRVWWSGARNIIGDDISDYVDRALDERPSDAPDWISMLPHWGDLGARNPRSTV